MEKVTVTYFSHYRQDDFDELNIRINDLPAQPTSAELVDDEHNAFLQVNPETKEIVGATIMYANDWFKEIADAFQRGDLEHPEVKFFLEHKIKEWMAERENREQLEHAIA
jgi:hypothetical protein